MSDPGKSRRMVNWPALSMQVVGEMVVMLEFVVAVPLFQSFPGLPVVAGAQQFRWARLNNSEG